MTTRQQRRAAEREQAKRHGSSGGRGGGRSGRSGISMDEVMGIMTGVGPGREIVTIDQIPEEVRDEFRKVAEDMEKAGEGPVTFVKKGDGSYSIITSPQFEGFDGLR